MPPFAVFRRIAFTLSPILLSTGCAVAGSQARERDDLAAQSETTIKADGGMAADPTEWASQDAGRDSAAARESQRTDAMPPSQAAQDGGGGVPDASGPRDDCPDDPLKLYPGTCGCGIADDDDDDDQLPNCLDGCPDDPSKQQPGVCGCNEADAGDRDGDGTLDCIDGCADDPYKTAPGACGCGFVDEDADDNGTADCLDTPQLPIVYSALGRTLTTTQVYLDGVQTTHATVAPGSEVALRVVGSVVDSDASCASCVTQLYARLNEVFALCLGSSTGDFSVDASTTFTAPEQPGVYFINPAGSWQFDCVDDLSAASFFSSGTFATLVVR